jgi:hypothetical protein
MLRSTSRLLAAVGALTWLSVLLVLSLREDPPGFPIEHREGGEWLATASLAVIGAVPVRLLHAERVALHPVTLAAFVVALLRATIAAMPSPGAFSIYLDGFTSSTTGIAAGALAALVLYARSARPIVPVSVGSWVPLAVATIGWVEIVLGALSFAGLSAFGPVLMAAGLLTFAAGALSVAATSAKWRAGLALPAAPIVAVVAYLLFVFASGGYVPPTAWEIPKDYRGWVVTAYEIPTCPALERDGLVVVVRVDAAGHACTSDRWRSGWIVSQDVFFVDQGQRVEKVAEAQEGRDGDQVRVHSHQSSQSGSCPMAHQFFVGTADDQRRLGATPNRRGLGCDLRPSP